MPEQPDLDVLIPDVPTKPDGDDSGNEPEDD